MRNLDENRYITYNLTYEQAQKLIKDLSLTFTPLGLCMPIDEGDNPYITNCVIDFDITEEIAFALPTN